MLNSALLQQNELQGTAGLPARSQRYLVSPSQSPVPESVEERIHMLLLQAACVSSCQTVQHYTVSWTSSIQGQSLHDFLLNEAFINCKALDNLRRHSRLLSIRAAGPALLCIDLDTTPWR